MSDYSEHLINMAGGDGEPDLDAIQARADAATEGPWEIIGGNEYLTGVDVCIGSADEGGIRLRDAEFIAHARTDVPALLALVRDQAAKLGRVAALAEEWRYKGENGWGAWQEGEGPDPEGYLLDCAAGEVRAALTATEASK